MRHRTMLAIFTAAISLPAAAFAQAPSINAPPTGPGTTGETAAPAAPAPALRPGIEASAQVGTGFTDTYGFGLGARAGYTFPLNIKNAPVPMGLYGGGVFTYYWGNNVTTDTEDQSSHAWFVGAEGALKVFPTEHIEIRPYVFLGPAFIKQVTNAPFTAESKTRFGVEPGVLGAYHFGNAFLSAEARFYVTPDPTAFTLMGGAGWGFE
jgi:hypothetical protein